MGKSDMEMLCQLLQLLKFFVSLHGHFVFGDRERLAMKGVPLKRVIEVKSYDSVMNSGEMEEEYNQIVTSIAGQERQETVNLFQLDAAGSLAQESIGNGSYRR